MMLDGALAMPAAALAAVLLDRLLGEARHFHPLVGFGNLAAAVEKRLNNRRLVPGLFAWALVVLPFVALAWLLRPYAPFAVDVALLYFALGAQSLCEHAEAIAKPLQDGHLDEARQRVSWIVSRDTSTLDESGIAKAGVESVLENGNDAIFGTLFWFALLGGPGALLFRLANTLDAMWGYRTERFNLFGRFAARFDDALNWVPARLTALTYALLGQTRNALACWRTQAPGWDSPNAGPVMSAGAGSLGVQLGGAAIYHGQEEIRPPLGSGPAPVAADLGRAIALIRQSLWLWLSAFFVIGFLDA
ncbi:adenosylcobinamide-phosphate synthase CbiB [Ferribacterium limneticum]|uniref:adenosylcobinamide-phosphate synthase CbiB n=1 Tax=Ferribacterium limneticum TaxID=76259 RepID=UPI001CFA1A96|nr:adenosylcobinamide-phosphate synthase CbiB [Ferribacterium limneticum]UCV28681.1 cobalamin biosynthesis protein [Ferribacterium limneticum]UCV32598.1 cobalamin biosynthesis protein [Ferribacterium limneticum]